MRGLGAPGVCLTSARPVRGAMQKAWIRALYQKWPKKMPRALTLPRDRQEWPSKNNLDCSSERVGEY